MNKFLDLEYLRSLNIEPQWFGLGFIQMKLNHQERLHFWSDKLHPNSGHEEEAHNHRYDFNSTVLKGELRDELWEIECAPKIGEWALWRVTCQPNDPAEMICEVNVRQVHERVINQGQTYHMPEPCFHRSFPVGNVITHLVRGPIVAEHAKVLREVGREHICPFRIVLPQGQLWELIGDIIHG